MNLRPLIRSKITTAGSASKVLHTSFCNLPWSRMTGGVDQRPGHVHRAKFLITLLAFQPSRVGVANSIRTATRRRGHLLSLSRCFVLIHTQPVCVNIGFANNHGRRAAGPASIPLTPVRVVAHLPGRLAGTFSRTTATGMRLLISYGTTF